MASPSPCSSLLILLITPFLFLIITGSPLQAQAQAQAQSVVLTNLTGILDKAGQYTTFIRLLTSTQISNQISTQLQYSDQGTTVFAPTDDAFNNLKPGTLNDLSIQQQVEFVLSHVLPKYYSLVMFDSISNPVRTEATGEDRGAFSLYFTSTTYNQVNVSTGIVDTQVNNALQQEFPLAVYQVDKVLLPLELFRIKTAPAPASLSPLAATNPSNKGPKKSPSSVQSKNSTLGSSEVSSWVGFGRMDWDDFIFVYYLVKKVDSIVVIQL